MQERWSVARSLCRLATCQLGHPLKDTCHVVPSRTIFFSWYQIYLIWHERRSGGVLRGASAGGAARRQLFRCECVFNTHTRTHIHTHTHADTHTHTHPHTHTHTHTHKYTRKQERWSVARSRCRWGGTAPTVSFRGTE